MVSTISPLPILRIEGAAAPGAWVVHPLLHALLCARQLLDVAMRPAAETLLELLRGYRCETDDTLEQLAEAFIDALLDEVSVEIVEAKRDQPKPRRWED